MHPDQQGRVAGRVRLAGYRVGAADPFVDLSYPVGRRSGGRAVAVGDGQHVGGGGGEAGGRVVAPVAVLVDAGHRERVQRLQQQRPQRGDRRRQVRVQPPRDAVRAEEAVVGGVDGDARRRTPPRRAGKARARRTRARECLSRILVTRPARLALSGGSGHGVRLPISTTLPRRCVRLISGPRVHQPDAVDGDPADRELADLVVERVEGRRDEVVADDRGGLLLRRGDQRLGHAGYRGRLL